MPASPLSLDDFDYALSPRQIARRPAARRDRSRLLLVLESVAERRFSSLPSCLRRGDVLAVNDSRVLPARLLGRKESGGQIEIFAERFLENGRMLAQLRASRPPKVGDHIFAAGEFVVREKTAPGFYVLQARSRGGDAASARARFLRRGQTPLPPYLRRPPEAEDKERYQTVFARRLGSVAAPTAGLHFTSELIAKLKTRGIDIVKITLHVGAGTFAPLRPGEERLHRERFAISAAAAAKINAAKKEGRRIVAVGTTSLRALESAADNSGVHPTSGETDLFIRPGFRFRAADLLLTNFHLPRSSLLVLACAFGGRRRVLAAYQQAAASGFRFYSYGDAMLLSPGRDDD